MLDVVWQRGRLEEYLVGNLVFLGLAQIEAHLLQNIVTFFALQAKQSGKFGVYVCSVPARSQILDIFA